MHDIDTSIDFVMRDHILANIPGTFFRDAAREIRRSSQEADAACASITNLFPAHAEGLFPHTRRAITESRLLALGLRYGLNSQCVQLTSNNKGNSYTRIRSGCFEFSCHHTERGSLPREAYYRLQAAQANQHIRQLDLKLEEQVIDESAPIYALICYETDLQNPHAVGAITVKIPRGEPNGGTICSFDIADLMEKNITPAIQAADEDIQITPRRESAAQ